MKFERNLEIKCGITGTYLACRKRSLPRKQTFTALISAQWNVEKPT